MAASNNSDVPFQPFAYVGSELTLFSQALTWKNYVYRQILPFLSGQVVEIGAGLGSTTAVFSQAEAVAEWLAIEPDATLAAQIPVSDRIRAMTGTLSDLPPQGRFDAILYIDVIEHIEDAAAELRTATAHLRAGGRLIVLVPAHNFLFSELDRALGHFRRYNKSMLATTVPNTLQLQRLRYLDCVGLTASLANKLFLKQSIPTEGQLLFWDRILVRASTGLDALTGYQFGKSLLGIWTKPAE